MSKYLVSASEVVVYEEREVEAEDVKEAEEKYTNLFSNPDTAPFADDSNGFETTIKLVKE